MQLKTVKTAADLPFKGIELVKVDASIKEVIIGGKLRIQSDYGLRVVVEVPGETAKRHRVTATIEGFGDKVEYYDASYLAATAASKLEALGAKVETAEVSVLVDEFGAVVADAPADATPTEEVLEF